MDTTVLTKLLQTIGAFVFLWLLIVAIFYTLIVYWGGNPRITIRWLYVVFFLAFAAYLMLLSPYRIEPSLKNPLFWVLIILLIVIFALLLFTYPRAKRGAV